MKSPGATSAFACAVYAVVESQVPGFQLNCLGATLQVTLSSRQAARFTCVGVPNVQLSAPVFMKNATNVPVSPSRRFAR